MKLVTFEVDSSVGPLRRVGALVGENVVDLQLAYARHLRRRGTYRAFELASATVPNDLLPFIENGPVAMEAAERAIEFAREEGDDEPAGGQILYRREQVRLRAPMSRPTAIRDTLNFEQHMRNSLRIMGVPDGKPPELWYQVPSYYRTTNTNVAGPDDPIIWPSYTEQLDYELEFACCIGKEGINIPRERAGDYIFGYTVYNDVSARDILQKELSLRVGPAKGKNFLNSNIIGPCIVTADEIDPDNLKMVARINGDVWSEGSSSGMQFKFVDLVAYLSKEETIYPGELICSGTVGFGCCMELGKWIKPGDVVELEVEGIGVLRNRVERRG